MVNIFLEIKLTDNNICIHLKTPVHLKSCFLYSAVLFKLKLKNLSINVTLSLKLCYVDHYVNVSNIFCSLIPLTLDEVCWYQVILLVIIFLCFYNFQKSVYILIMTHLTHPGASNIIVEGATFMQSHQGVSDLYMRRKFTFKSNLKENEK